MTVEQVQLLRGAFTVVENKETITQGYTVTFDDGTKYDSRTSFLFMDDDNKLATAIRTNNDHYTNTQAPFEVNAGSYDKILHMEGFVDMKHLMQVVNAVTNNKLSDYQKTCIIKWADSINNANIAPMEKRPYFKEDPVIPGKFHEPIARDDLEPGDTVYDQGGFDNA